MNTVIGFRISELNCCVIVKCDIRFGIDNVGELFSG